MLQWVSQAKGRVSWPKAGGLGLQPPPTPVSHEVKATKGETILRYVQLFAQVSQGAPATQGSSDKGKLRAWTLRNKSWTTRGHKKGLLRVSDWLGVRTKDSQGWKGPPGLMTCLQVAFEQNIHSPLS